MIETQNCSLQRYSRRPSSRRRWGLSLLVTTSTAVATLLLAAGLGKASAADLCINPGFEDGTDPAAPPWSFWGGTGGAQPNPFINTDNPSPRVWANFGNPTYVNVAAQNNMSGVWLVPGATYHVHAQYYVPSSEVLPGVTPRAGIYFSMMSGLYRLLDPRYPDSTNNAVSASISALDKWYTFDFDWVFPGTTIQQVSYGSFRLYGGDGTNLSTAAYPNPGGYFDNCQISSAAYRSDLTGVVKDNTGAPLAGVAVVLSSSYAANLETNTTAADGTYTFSTLAPLGYTFTVSATYGAYSSDGPKSLAVSSTANTFPLITMTAPNITVSGTVKQSDGTPVEATVKVTAGTYTSGAVVATGGNFSFSPLPSAPSYTVTATKTGFLPNPASVTTTNPALPVNIVMNPDPSYDPTLLVHVEAAGLGSGSLNNWFNQGSLGGQFVADGAKATAPPTVTSYLGKQAVSFNNTKLMLSTDNTTADGSVILAPAAITGNGTYTVNALVASDHALPGEQYYLAWSHNGGSGNCAAFDYGTASAWGAVAHWGSTDMGWFNPEKTGGPSIGLWHYVTITFDGATEKVYLDGVQVNTENKTLALWPNDPIVVGSRFSDDTCSDRSAPFNGGLASLRVYNRALSSNEVAVITSHAYTITATAGVGGTISPAGPLGVDAGDQPTYQVTPALGYAIADVQTNGVSVGAVASFTFPPISASQTISVTFTELPKQTVSGNVNNGTAGIAGATVYFSTSTNASVAPLYTATTVASPAGDYSVQLQPGTWYACASATGYNPSSDITITVAGTAVSGQNITLTANGRNIPAQSNLLFAVLADSLPASGAIASWPAFLPKGVSLSKIGNPTVGTIGPARAEVNVADSDGFKFGAYPAGLTFNGGTIVAVVQPVTGLTPNAYQCVASVLLDRFELLVQRDTGMIRAVRGGSWFDGPTLPYGQATVLSFVVQPTGQFKVYANGSVVMDVTSTFDFTTLTPAAWYMVDVNVGRGWEGDGWSSFSGNIGDVFVYKTALSDADRVMLEGDVGAKFNIPVPTIPFTGKVTRQDGVTPIANALVTANGALGSFTGTTGTNGTYSMYLISGDTYTASVTKDGFIQANANFSGVVAAATTYNFQMIPANTVQGTVKNASGTPINNAVVQIGDGGPAAVTGPDGKYSLVITPGPGTSFYADAFGYADDTETIDTSAAATGVMTKDVVLSAKDESDFSYLQNGDFETGTLGPWVGTGSPIVGVTNSEHASGSYCGYWQSTESGWYHGYLQQTIPIIPGSTYNMYFKLKTSAAVGQCGFSFLDGAGNEIPWWGYDGAPMPGANWMYGTVPNVWEQAVNYRSWDNSQKLTAVRVTPPTGAVNIRFVFGLGADAVGQTLYVDDVVLDRVGPAVPKWAGANNGAWNTPGNWAAGVVPTSTDIPIFSVTNAGATVQLDAPVTVGGLYFNNLVPNTTIASSLGNTLTLSGSTVTVLGGSHTISAAIDASTAGMALSGPGTLTLSGSGTGRLSVDNAGLVLSGSGSWIDPASHYVVIDRGSGTTGTLTINGNGTFDCSLASALCLAWGTGDTGMVVQNGGTVKTPAFSTAWYNNNGPGVILGSYDSTPSTAEYDLNGGVLITPNIYNVNENSSTTNLLAPAGSAIFRFNGGVLQGTQSDNQWDPDVVAEGTTNLMGNLTHAYVAGGGAKIDTVTFSCGINQALEHDPNVGTAPDGGLTKLGTGTLTLYKASTYTGPTRVQGGILACANALALGGGTLDLSTGAQVALNYTGSRAIAALSFDGVAQANGTYGATGSGATHIDDTHFTGAGMLTVGPTPIPVLTTGGFTHPSGVPTFTFNTVAGYKYRVVYKNALTDTTWQELAPGFVLSTGAPMTVTDAAVGQPQRFYRIEAAIP